MTRRISISAYILILSLAAAPLSNANADSKKLYKWIDSSGEVHYTDTVPPQAAPKGRTILNGEGITVDRVDAAKTPEELAEQARIAKLRAARQRKAAQQATRDRLLLNTYASEHDIINARNSQLSAIQNLISISTDTLGKLNRRLTHQLKSAADAERAGRAVPPYLVQRMSDLRGQIGRIERYISGKRAEQTAIRASYEKDLHRFRQLSASKTGTPSDGQ